jgi:glycine cleavage system aminomethyltransferase T
MDSELTGGDALTTQLDHPRALIETDDMCAPRVKFLGVQTRATRGVQDDTTSNITEKFQTCGPVAMSVEQVVARKVEEFVGEAVVLRMRTNGVRHTSSVTHNRAANAMTRNRLSETGSDHSRLSSSETAWTLVNDRQEY